MSRIKYDTDDLLVDAIAMSVLHDTFNVPHESDIRKAMWATERPFFKVSAGGERFWVEVVTTYQTTGFIVRVDNDLLATHVHGLKLNDLIKIEYYNILEIKF